MGSLTRLFSASGSINALKYIAERRIKSGAGILFASFCSMVLVAIDEYLSVLINGACFVPLTDQKRVPREKSAMVMGMTPGALCIISPISLTGIYLAGMIAMSGGKAGMFFTAIPFNFTALLTVFFVLLFIIGKAPLFGGLRAAIWRVKDGGPLWPEGTDIEEEEGGTNRGRIANLILPILVFAASSIITGTLEAGSFSVNVLYGMFITLIFTFLLYCFQRYMTPEQFFKNIVFGIENMLAPIVMFVVSKCFANGITEIGFSGWLNEIVQQLLGGQAWLLPAIIFGLCTLVGALFDNPWAMFAIGIPIALNLSTSLQGNPGLYIGAVCAAGLVGNEIAMGDIFFIGPMLGVNPIAYYRTKMPYVILITLLAFLGYMAAGYFVR
jgi:Na+/H+ antiporter NhaC